MSSVATCKLNSRFLDALSNPRVYKGHSFDGYGNTLTCIRDKKHVFDAMQPKVRGMGCCGMEELNFECIQFFWDTLYKDDLVGFEAVVAHVIKGSRPEGDSSVMVVGIPTKTNSDSMYNIDFYKRLREVLDSFGFVTLCKPYKNKNSGNEIVAMAGQLP